MPIYEFECLVCEQKEEVVTKGVVNVPESLAPVCVCGIRMGLVFSLAGLPPFRDFYTENITGRPVEITSREQKRKLLRQYGLSEAG